MSCNNFSGAEHFLRDLRFMKHFVKRKTQTNVLFMESQSAEPEKVKLSPVAVPTVLN